MGKALGSMTTTPSGLGQFLADMAPQLGHHGLVVPLARADEELDRLARQPGLDGDRLTGLALQTADQAVDDKRGVDSLLDAIELGQVTLEEGGQPVGAALNSVGGDVGVVQEGLSLGVIQERHRGASERRA